MCRAEEIISVRELLALQAETLEYNSQNLWKDVNTWGCAIIILAFGNWSDEVVGPCWSASPAYWASTRPTKETKQQNQDR